MLEGGEALIRLRYRRVEDGLPVALQIQVLEAEHLPTTMNRDLPATGGASNVGNVIRSGIEFDRLGRRVAYHLHRSHPNDGLLAPMSSQGGMDTVRVDAREVIHLFRPLRPGQIRGEPWLTRALVKLNELDQYDDAELVRKKTAAMFAGFITRMAPEDNLMGESAADANGVALAGMEPGTLQILEPGEDIKFSAPADVGSSYVEFMRQQFRAVAAAMGITYEMLTGDLTQVNYSSIRAGLLEFRRRCDLARLDGPGGARRCAGLASLPKRPPHLPGRQVDSAGLELGRSAEGIQRHEVGYPCGPHEPIRGHLRQRLRR